jgi:hypothetical protein
MSVIIYCFGQALQSLDLQVKYLDAVQVLLGAIHWTMKRHGITGRHCWGLCGKMCRHVSAGHRSTTQVHVRATSCTLQCLQHCQPGTEITAREVTSVPSVTVHWKTIVIALLSFVLRGFGLRIAASNRLSLTLHLHHGPSHLSPSVDLPHLSAHNNRYGIGPHPKEMYMVPGSTSKPSNLPAPPQEPPQPRKRGRAGAVQATELPDAASLEASAPARLPQQSSPPAKRRHMPRIAFGTRVTPIEKRRGPPVDPHDLTGKYNLFNVAFAFDGMGCP